MAALLIYTDGGPNRVELAGARITVGRAPGNDVVIDHPDVAPQHCVFELAGDGRQFQLVDLGSAQGTCVRQRRIARWNLMSGDEITLGAVRLVFQEGPGPEPAAAAVPAAPETPPEPKPPEGAVRRLRRETAAPQEDTAPEPAAPAVVRRPKRRRLDTAEGVVEEEVQAAAEDLDALADLRDVRQRILGQLRKIIVGQEEVIEQMLLALLCNGHCLLVGLPGLAKTLLVRSLARIFNLTFRRIQFTPDLMPADIIGTNVIQENITTGERSFKFIQGPLFTNILLADEINRTPPKTQAALLEAMQERAVTVAGKTLRLPEPFFVLATQNPIEQEGTYPLPEAQLDRFMFHIVVPYPSREEESRIYKQTTSDYRPTLENVVTGEEILRLQQIIRRIPVSDYVVQFVTTLVRRTRPEDPSAGEMSKKYVKWGAGPRAGQYLILAAKARAVLRGRLNVDLADVREIALPVFRHRIGINFNAEAEGITADEIVRQLLRSTQAATTP